ncbi:hypothetical protein E2C01_030928 [Portunus trituberculatus]|uniref:Uncharacterized protein n=1 Tax=Portunus trituberculatus TaxID=210409 RepID=A0A5B7EWP6_PORTR|nr:hypothetical protein [Portunus trituberculatus]
MSKSEATTDSEAVARCERAGKHAMTSQHAKKRTATCRTDGLLELPLIYGVTRLAVKGRSEKQSGVHQFG